MSPNPNNEEVDVVQQSLQGLSLQVIPAEEDTDLYLSCLDLHKGDEAKAKKHHQDILVWRRERGMDTILTSHHEHWDVLKELGPTYLCGRARDGSAVNYELVGHFDHPAMQKRYGKDDDGHMERHIVLHTEYIRCVLHGRDPSRAELIVLDFEGITMTKLLNPYMLTATRLYADALVVRQAHRIRAILVVNLKFGASWMKRLLWVAMPRAFADKLQLISDLSELQQYVAPEQLPVKYGGTNTTPLPDWPEEAGLRRLVLEAKEREGK